MDEIIAEMKASDLMKDITLDVTVTITGYRFNRIRIVAAGLIFCVARFVAWIAGIKIKAEVINGE